MIRVALTWNRLAILGCVTVTALFTALIIFLLWPEYDGTEMLQRQPGVKTVYFWSVGRGTQIPLTEPDKAFAQCRDSCELITHSYSFKHKHIDMVVFRSGALPMNPPKKYWPQTWLYLSSHPSAGEIQNYDQLFNYTKYYRAKSFLSCLKSGSISSKKMTPNQDAELLSQEVTLSARWNITSCSSDSYLYVTELQRLGLRITIEANHCGKISID